MNEEKFYDFLQKQILLLVGWSLVAGLGIVLLCLYYDIVQNAILWYAGLVTVSIWGFILHKQYKHKKLNVPSLESWYLSVKLFIYVTFGLWTTLFILYVGNTQSNLHLIVIFTQISAAVIAATLLFSDKTLFVPILLILMYPLVVVFMGMGEANGYFLSLFSLFMLALLLYISHNSNLLIKQIYYQAQHDGLTGLFNRRYLIEYLDQMLHSFKNSHMFAYVCLIDLDHFKTINDSLGHDVGDNLLSEVSDRIKSYCEESHLIARIGGDEFMIISYEFETMEECEQEAEVFAKVLGEILKKTYIIDYNHVHISASIGIKFIDRMTLKTSQVIKEADIAMYEAKEEGRDGVVNFNTQLAKQVDNALEIERKLYFALKNNEIELYYQAQVNPDKHIIGCEVLTRWYNPELGFISPMVFIDLAEKTGIIIELGNYILEESFKTLQQWQDKGIRLESYSVNLSVRQLVADSFVEHVEYLCDRYLKGDTRKILIFEITESLLAEDITKIVKIINKIKKLGIKFSMDDFGTGYSSLSYLRELPIDELKIDRAFVKILGEKESDEMMIKTIFSLADIFNLSVVAEGIETGEQFRMLLAHDCKIYQGYYFAKPMNKSDFEVQLLRDKVQKVNIELNERKEENRNQIII